MLCEPSIFLKKYIKKLDFSPKKNVSKKRLRFEMVILREKIAKCKKTPKTIRKRSETHYNGSGTVGECYVNPQIFWSRFYYFWNLVRKKNIQKTSASFWCVFLRLLERAYLDTHPRAISTFPHPHPKSDGSYPKTILNKFSVGVGFASFAFKIREIRFLKIRTQPVKIGAA